MKKTIYINLLLAFLVNTAYGMGSASGTITQIGTHLDDWNTANTEQQGIFYFHVSGLPEACTSTGARIVIPTTHPLYETVVSIVLTAQAQSKSVIVNYHETCTYRATGWDFATINML